MTAYAIAPQRFRFQRDAETVPAMPAVDTAAIANAPTVRPPRSAPYPVGVASSSAPASGVVLHVLRARFTDAIASLAVKLEPVVDSVTKRLLGFSVKMSSKTESLESEMALVDAAERLDEVARLRRRARELAVVAFAAAPSDALLFVDVHPDELVESDLYSPSPELLALADRVVLQVRGSELDIGDLSARASVLRFVGFRIALADVDADHCVAQIVELSPEFVKLDTRIVRGIDRSFAKRRVVAALVSMCRSLDAVTVAEGVSTAEEREALVDAGCSFVQGALVSHHGLVKSLRPFVTTLHS